MAVSLFFVGCSGRVEQDPRPTFHIDATQPFRLEFGRGSGWQGLETVKIDQSGCVVLHRMKRERREDATLETWETATLSLPPDGLADVLKAIDENGLMGLHKSYSTDVQDGTQWVLWIKQGEREKSVYFNNSFPNVITRFAEQLDGTLAAAELDKVTWQPVPPSESRQHERELWNSIKR